MELIEDHYGHIAPLLPVRWGNVRVLNLQVPDAIPRVLLNMAANGGGCRPGSGVEHTIHVRMNR